MQYEKLGEDSNTNAAPLGIEMMFRLVKNEAENMLPYIEMKSKVLKDSKAPRVLLFPGIEGFSSIYQDLTKQIDAHTVAVQPSLDGEQTTIIEMAKSVTPVNDYLLIFFFQ